MGGTLKIISFHTPAMGRITFHWPRVPKAPANLGLAIPDSLLGFVSASEQEAVKKGRGSCYHFEISSPKLIPAANTETQLLSVCTNPLVLISFFPKDLV